MGGEQKRTGLQLASGVYEIISCCEVCEEVGAKSEGDRIHGEGQEGVSTLFFKGGPPYWGTPRIGLDLPTHPVILFLKVASNAQRTHPPPVN
jgi:hypothetical protein